MLLLVALCAVFFAWVGARMELHRIHVKEELRSAELWRNFARKHPGTYISEEAWKSDLKDLDAMIAEKRKSLGMSDH
jgi:hypothetical protein